MDWRIGHGIRCKVRVCTRVSLMTQIYRCQIRKERMMLLVAKEMDHISDE
ncbi:unnamed protein product, partial [Musa acuminata var. zebrina]